MKKKRIQLKDKTKISKILNKNNYLLISIGIIFLVIDYDLFSSQPKYLITEGYFWKGAALVFQFIFIASIIQWELKKKLIINILNNGIFTEGILQFSERIKTRRGPAFYIHLFKYEVNGETYEVSFKNKNNIVTSHKIIYQANFPKKSLVFEELKPELQELIKKFL